MRQIGPLRFIGLVPMLFALGFVWMPGKQLLRSLAEIIADKDVAIAGLQTAIQTDTLNLAVERWLAEEEVRTALEKRPARPALASSR